MNADFFSPTGVSPVEAARSGRLPHAVVLQGANADTRLSTARQTAQVLVCEADDAPCGECSACRRIAVGTHPDVLEYTGGDKARTFKVDVVREVRDGAYILPNEAPCKVYILIGCEDMTSGAQNALLKVLEEPPGLVYFILLCTDSGTLLSTVLSRSRVFTLGALEASGDTEKLAAAREAAEKLAVATLSPKRPAVMLAASAAFEKDRELLRLALPEFRSIIRDALVLCHGGKTISYAPQTAARLADAHTQARLMRLAERARELEISAEGEANLNLLVTRVCSRLK